MIRYADVVVDIPIEQDSLTYFIPNEFKNLSVGCRVQVEVKSRIEIGIIHRIHENPPNFETKPIKKVIDLEPIITEDQWKIAKWIQETYVSTLGEAVFRMVPHGRTFVKKSDDFKDELEELKILNDEQSQAYKKIIQTIGNPTVHLIYGITGSGKTEVYIHTIRYLLENTNKTVIFLVPEISLSYHTINRFNKIFPNQVTLIHSSLKTSQRYRAYQELLKKEKRIVIGTRSAVFSPVRDLGLIIMDEEHDGSYKENSSPRYHAKQVAYHRILESKALLILGSATPSIESFYLAKTGKIHLHILSKRAVENSNLPELRIIQKKESEGPISFELMNEISKQIQNKEQTLILLNRRGYSPLIFDKDNKKFIECPNCSTYLCFHKPNIIQCHICGFKDAFENLKLKSPHLELIGSGTQKIEEFLLMKFPEARIERLDQDVSRKPEVMSGILKRLYNNELDILTGTQMIAKGLDIPNLTLVGVINANQGLNIPDFRASEKVFSLITQVSGRAGRHGLPGRVVIEAVQINHPVLKKALQQDYIGFYEDEILYRMKLNLPPFTKLLRLVIRSPKEDISRNEIKNIYDIICEENIKEIQILGPSPCPIQKIDKNYRFHILIKTKTHQHTRMLVKKIKSVWNPPKNVYLEVDFDPMDLM